MQILIQLLPTASASSAPSTNKQLEMHLNCEPAAGQQVVGLTPAKSAPTPCTTPLAAMRPHPGSGPAIELGQLITRRDNMMNDESILGLPQPYRRLQPVSDLSSVRHVVD